MLVAAVRKGAALAPGAVWRDIESAMTLLESISAENAKLRKALIETETIIKHLSDAYRRAMSGYEIPVRQSQVLLTMANDWLARAEEIRKAAEQGVPK